MGRSPSRYVIILPSLMAIGTLVRDIVALVCHVISKDHMIKGSCDFMGGSLSQ